MSRCFPFPPPGYEKKPRSSEHGDLLAKEKHKEKKHKKEKEVKEKGERKERKDRDTSKDKHKERKDRKEKHKDKKRDRDRDKIKVSEDQRTDHRTEVLHETKLGNDSRKSEEVRDSKFTEELGRRIRNEEQETANRMVEDFSATTHRRIGSMGASPAMGKESVTGNKMVTDVTGTVQRRNEKLAPSFPKRAEGLETAIIADRQKVASSEKVPDLISAERRRNDNLSPPMQKKIESMGTSMVMEKQRSASKQKSEDFTSADQRRNQVITGCLVENFSSSVERRTEGMVAVNSMQKERRIENISAAPTMEKERSAFPNTISIEQRRTDGIGVPVEKDKSVEKDTHKKMEGKEKTKEKKAEDGKSEGHKDRDRNEKKRKEKDKDRHKEKKKEEKKRGKGEHKHRKHDKLRASGMKDQTNNLNNKNLAPHKENVNCGGVDVNNKKRKNFEINGFLHEPHYDGRPNKLPKTSASSSHPTLENGSMELVSVASPCPSRKLGAINNTKRSPDNNDNLINGKVEVEPLHSLRSLAHVVVDLTKSDELHVLKPGVSSFTVDLSKSDEVHVLEPLVPLPQVAVNSIKRLGPQVATNSKSLVPQVPINSKSLVPPVAVNSIKSLVPPPAAANSSKSLVTPVAANSSKIDQVPSRPPHPHPDVKYLGSIYSVPKMEDLLEYDDHQEWLFSSEIPQSNMKLEDEGTPPQVWAKGVQIDAADVFALPYVIPF